MSVLGALVAVEAAGGPSMPMHWGRRKGQCAHLTCNQHDCIDEEYAIDTSPKMYELDDPGHFRSTFEHLGFGPRAQVALMGAHTFGKANVCAGGLNGVMRGPWCADPEKVSPPISSAHLYPNCQVQPGNVTGCWKQESGNSRRLGSALGPTFKPELRPIWPIYGKYLEKNRDAVSDAYEMLSTDVAIGEGFGDGAFFRPDTRGFRQ